MDLWTAAWLGVKAAKLLERVEFLWKSDSGQDFYSFFFFSFLIPSMRSAH